MMNKIKKNQLYETTISKFQTEKTELEKSYNKKIQQSQNEITFNKKKVEQKPKSFFRRY